MSKLPDPKLLEEAKKALSNLICSGVTYDVYQKLEGHRSEGKAERILKKAMPEIFEPPFEPKKVEIKINSEKEMLVAKLIAGANVTIPEYVRKNAHIHDLNPEEAQGIARKILSNLHRALRLV